jgi:hypothetical protein
MSEAVRINEWRSLRFSDPEPELIRLREVQLALADYIIDPKVGALRTNPLNSDRQRREAAIFCYAISHALGIKIYYAPVERQDYDFVAVWQRDDTQFFAPVQLKELVPAHVNPSASLAALLSGLEKYRNSPDLVVAIHFNRGMRLNFAEVLVPKLALGQVWLYGAISPDQSKWMLYGDLLDQPAYYDIPYPS